MRIPKFAFALLVIAIVALGSGLAVISARAHTVGSVLMLTVKGPHADNLRCALSLVDKKWGICAQLSPPQYLLSVEVLSHTEDQVELGIREQYNPAPVGAGSHTTGLEDLQKIPQKSYWFRPGQKLQIDVSGAGPLVLTGGLTDHIPPFPGLPEVEMDPKANELRVTSPLLLRGEKVVFDDEGASSIQKDRGVVQMYWPGQGLWVLSLHPLEGAVEGHVSLSRVKFAIDGQAYTFVMAAPVSRADHIWILHDPNYKPSDPNLNNGFLSAADPEHLANSSQVQSLGK